MGASDQPYMYTPSSQRRVAYPYSDFNPKAVTQASYIALQERSQPRPKQQGPLINFDRHQQPRFNPKAVTQASQERPKPRPKQDGPLINFNQHPDSYMVVTGQNVHHEPMPANTKKTVAALRWVQLTLRVIEEIAALGLLVCVICIKGMPTTLSWIFRIAPAWDVIVTIYAIYHLARSSKARTPASSASYHIFALFMDLGLTPFYVFTSLFANNNYMEAPGTKGRWTSFFTEPGATNTILFTTFVGTAVIASLHFVSALLDLCLVIIFRKISKLPPDMNPLEDNLTSRASTRTSKHKYKNNEISLTESMPERKPGYLSGSTISVDQQSRLSTATKNGGDLAPRTVPFHHSRIAANNTFSPHTPETARLSHQRFEEVKLYEQSESARGSQSDFGVHGTFAETVAPSYPADRAGTGIGKPSRYSSPALPNAAPSNALVQSQQKQSLLNDNWFVVGDDNSGPGTPNGERTPRSADKEDGSIPSPRRDSFEPQPLKMNPPTPPVKQQQYPDPENEEANKQLIKRKALADRRDQGNGDANRYLTVQRTLTTTSSVYSESAPSLTSSDIKTSPKARYYGNLAAATRGVRQTKSNDRLQSNGSMQSNGTVGASAFDSTGMSALGSYGYSSPERSREPSPERRPASPTKKESKQRVQSNGTIAGAHFDSTGLSALGSYGYTSQEPLPQRAVVIGNGLVSPCRDSKGRVISRTGVDITDVPALYHPGTGSGVRGRREVSGKVAEEGRVGGWTGRRQH